MKQKNRKKNLEKMLGEATTIKEKLDLLTRYWSKEGEFIRPFRSPSQKEYKISAEIYEKARMFEKAGHFAELAGYDIWAIQNYEKAGLYGRAASLCNFGPLKIIWNNRDRKLAERGVRNFIRFGDHHSAARLAEKTGLYGLAFKLNVQTHCWYDAAEVAVKLKLNETARKLYQNAYEENPPMPIYWRAQAAIKGKIPGTKEYVDHAIRVSRSKEAVELSILIGDIPRAARILELSSPPSDVFTRPYWFLTRYGYYEEALDLCLRHKEFNEAASCAESLHLYDFAIKLYRKSGNDYQARRVFELQEKLRSK